MNQLKTFLNMVRFEHSIFALPFAYMGMVLAWGDWESASWWDFIWITIAMISARTAAMALNRYIDRSIDARNPRTASRPLQVGAIDERTVLLLAVLSMILLALAAWMLNPLAFFLSPVALLFLVGYSYTKRFTWLSHYILGMTDGLAPMGAWIAVRGTIFTGDDLPAWITFAAVTFWIGGFDIYYACQDVEFDRQNHLYSIPATFGIPRGLQIAGISHIITILLMFALGFIMTLGWPFWFGVAAMAVLLAYEHLLVRPDDLSNINIAFFNINGYISIIIFAATSLAVFIS